MPPCPAPGTARAAPAQSAGPGGPPSASVCDYVPGVPLGRRRRWPGTGCGRWRWTARPQAGIAQQRCQRPGRPARGTPICAAGGHERANSRQLQISRTQRLRFQPPAQMRHQPQVNRHHARHVPPPGQLSGETRREWRQRTRHRNSRRISTHPSSPACKIDHLRSQETRRLCRLQLPEPGHHQPGPAPVGITHQVRIRRPPHRAGEPGTGWSRTRKPITSRS